MDERTYRGGVHPPYCTCVSCVARRSGPKPGRKVWRGKDVTSEGDSYWDVVNRQARRVADAAPEQRGDPYREVANHQARRVAHERDRARVPRIRRRSILSLLLTLAIGAALAVLVIYPLLPHDAKAKILRAQEEVTELAPWLDSR